MGSWKISIEVGLVYDEERSELLLTVSCKDH